MDQLPAYRQQDLICDFARTPIVWGDATHTAHFSVGSDTKSRRGRDCAGARQQFIYSLR
jgi:hypothetical protein